MEYQFDLNTKAPLLSWDFFCAKYNSLMEDAEHYHQTALEIKKIAKANKWAKTQLQEALDNIQQYVIVITNPLQKIAVVGKGFYEMTGYSASEAIGKNPKFLQGPATSNISKNKVREKLNLNESTEMVLENYRKNGEIYLCQILIKPVFNINQQVVNFIAYEREIAA